MLKYFNPYFYKYLWYKYVWVRSPLSKYSVWELDKETRRELLINGWSDKRIFGVKWAKPADPVKF